MLSTHTASSNKITCTTKLFYFCPSIRHSVYWCFQSHALVAAVSSMGISKSAPDAIGKKLNKLHTEAVVLTPASKTTHAACDCFSCRLHLVCFAIFSQQTTDRLTYTALSITTHEGTSQRLATTAVVCLMYTSNNCWTSAIGSVNVVGRVVRYHQIDALP